MSRKVFALRLFLSACSRLYRVVSVSVHSPIYRVLPTARINTSLLSAHPRYIANERCSLPLLLAVLTACNCFHGSNQTACLQTVCSISIYPACVCTCAGTAVSQAPLSCLLLLFPASVLLLFRSLRPACVFSSSFASSILAWPPLLLLSADDPGFVTFIYLRLDDMLHRHTSISSGCPHNHICASVTV